MSKYKAKKVKVGDITFDSKKEAQRWIYLRKLESQGEIVNLQRQVKYVLIPTQREPDIVGVRGGIKKGKLIESECSYYADFKYTQKGIEVIEDTKGFRTPEYKIKRKLMLYVHGIRIKEI